MADPSTPSKTRASSSYTAPITSKGKTKAAKHDPLLSLWCLTEGDNDVYSVSVGRKDAIRLLQNLVYQEAFDSTVHTFPPEYLLLLKVTTSQKAESSINIAAHFLMHSFRLISISIPTDAI